MQFNREENRMKKHEKKPKTYMKERIAKSLAVTLFAVLLTATAVYRPGSAFGRTTNTRQDGKTPISFTVRSKDPNAAAVYSDCQGFYFYVTPVDAQNSSLDYFPMSAKTLFEGSLAHTGVTYTDENRKKRTRTFRYYFINEEENIDSVRYRWIQDYNIARFQGYTSVIPQTQESLMFVPYVTWTFMWDGGSDSNSGSLKSGWKNDISQVCYYDKEASTLQKQYRVYSDRRYLNNRVFLTQSVYHNIRDNKMTEFDSLCKNGVFYSELAKLFVNKDNVDVDKNAIDLIDVTDMQKTFGTTAGIRNFINNSDLQNKSLKLWDYILQLNMTGSTMEFNAPSRIDEFLTKGYNNYIGKRNAAYSSSNPIGLNLTGSKKYKLENWNMEQKA